MEPTVSLLLFESKDRREYGDGIKSCGPYGQLLIAGKENRAQEDLTMRGSEQELDMTLSLALSNRCCPLPQSLNAHFPRDVRLTRSAVPIARLNPYAYEYQQRMENRP